MENQKHYEVIISQRATRMLVSHVSFLANVSREAATRLVTDFREKAKSLEQMPNRCPWLIAEFIPQNKYRYLIFQKRYLMIFQVKDNTVYVDYVVDTRQDYGWLIR